MQSRIVACAFLSISIVYGSTASIGAATNSNAPSSDAQTTGAYLYKGVVTNIDPVNNTIQIKDGRGILQTVLMDDGVLLMVRDSPVSLNDLKLGDQVTVQTQPPNSSFR